MINFHKDHANLVNVSLLVFVLLSTGVAVAPALSMQDNNSTLPDMPEMTAQERRGLAIYVSEGCIGCHTQQVRNVEMDKTWGARPSMPSDYFYSKQRPDIWHNTPSLLGSERTGPDLTNVGVRKGSEAWQMLHLYNPRMVEKASIMPRYGWLFTEVDSAHVKPDDVVLTIPADQLKKAGDKVIATQRAKDLVAYLLSLKQAALPTGEMPVAFIPTPGANGKPVVAAAAGAAPAVDGSKVFSSVCAACHQPDAKGLPGAFPALAGAELVNEKDPIKMVNIVLGGYNGLQNFGPMPPQAANLNDAQIAAVISYVRSHFGNNAPPVDAETVKTARAVIAPETAEK